MAAASYRIALLPAPGQAANAAPDWVLLSAKDIRTLLRGRIHALAVVGEALPTNATAL